MRGILSHDVLIPKEAGCQISALHVFCRAYVYEAAAAQKDFLPHFPLLPKLHFLHEVCFRMRRECQHSSHCFNPAAASCSMDEDFIGRAAQITRCVSPMLIPQRTLERYLCHIQLAWSREWHGVGAWDGKEKESWSTVADWGKERITIYNIFCAHIQFEMRSGDCSVCCLYGVFCLFLVILVELYGPNPVDVKNRIWT